MISVKEAKELISKHCNKLSPQLFSLQDAVGLILAEDVFSPIDIPSFPQSSMDGYAFCFKDLQLKDSLIINGEIQAGIASKIVLKQNEAVRIFTGAALPSRANTVVMQEKVIVNNRQLIINDTQLKQGSNVRLKGAEIRMKELALKANTPLNPATIGLLASLGISKIKAIPKPKVNIVITGNELVQPGYPLINGQVYDSNSYSLLAALSQLQIKDINLSFAKDNVTDLTDVLSSAINDCDILLITGGVSVGDYDLVANTLNNLQVDQLFHKVKQKPGKPLYVGKNRDCIIFGLPGNPSSTITCFYEYVTLAIERLMGLKKSIIQKKLLPLNSNYQKQTGLTHFLKAFCTENEVCLLSAQESYRLSSFANTNCLLCLDEEGTNYKMGDLVEVHLLP